MVIRWAVMGFIIATVFPCDLLEARPYDHGVDRVPWGCTWKTCARKLGNKVFKKAKNVPPYDLPYLRELGALYWLDKKNFAKVVVRNGADDDAPETAFFFYQDQLFCVRKQVSPSVQGFLTLLAKLQKGCGAGAKSQSKGPTGEIVSRQWKGKILNIDLDYRAFKNPEASGYLFEDIVILFKHKPAILAITKRHQALRKKYGWEAGEEDEEDDEEDE